MKVVPSPWGRPQNKGSDAFDYEKPAHQVTLSDYYIGQTEVTQELWEAVMGSNPSEFKGTKNPVEQFSWEEIVNDFVPKLNALTGLTFTIPTEAQWEFAARGGNKSQGYKYSGGNDASEYVWNGDYEFTHTVSQKLPNELGLYDMSGNVYEWCWDWFGEYSAKTQTNPVGPQSGDEKIIRGGYYCDGIELCRVSSRYMTTPDSILCYVGFRLVLA